MRAYLLVAAAIIVACIAWAEEAVKPPKPPKTPPLAGTILSVDMEAKTVTVSEQTMQNVLVLNEKSVIILKGPILDGVKAGDRVEAEVSDSEDGRKTVIKMTVTREGVSPSSGKAAPHKEKPKQPKKGGAEAQPATP